MAPLPRFASHAELLRRCDAGQLEGGLSVALDVRPDELIGSLCAAMGGEARSLKVEDVREKPVFEITIVHRGVTERWDVPELRALVHNLNDLLRDDPAAKLTCVLGEAEDALLLWCVPKAELPALLRDRVFAPENRAQLEALVRK